MTHGNLTEVGDNSRFAYRSRKESDPIDRGVLPADAVHGKIESLENALDQIYCKMKSELRDVRDSLKLINRYPESLSPLPPAKTNSAHTFSYPRTTEHVDV